ncbi:MAG: exodeoxyribonuclease VII large subunit [Candidatus Saccharimonadales bacterium]
MDNQVLQVSEFLALINQTLEFAYPRVMVEGEVTGYNVRQEKWIRFRLKDAESVVDCFMTVWQLKTPLEDGMKIVVEGKPKIYEKSGSFTLNVDKVTLSGEGALKRAYELLKNKLEKEGLFSLERKRPLPKYPKTIGLVTSLDSEAHTDFMEILNQRWSGVEVKAAHVQVQGEKAPSQIVGAIKYFNELPKPMDILVVTRGGGSLEDLQAFNTEEVTRAVATSRTPTIVGVGHEANVSLADLAADKRAATPTDAARLVVPEKTEVLNGIDYKQRQIITAVQGLLEGWQYKIRHSMQVINHAVSPANLRQQVNMLEQKLITSHKSAINQTKQNLLALTRTLKNLDPQTLLERGYGIARVDGQILKDASQVSMGDFVMLQLAKGKLNTEVRKIEDDSAS